MPIARTLWNQRIRARDGVELAADIMLPEGTGPFPTVIHRTPYVRGRYLNNPRGWLRLVDRGYAFMTVDVRGRNDSEGEWVPCIKDSSDGYDVVEWAARQPWCTGRIGMVGASYDGLTQWWTAAAHPPHLRCIAPLCIGGVLHRLPFATGIPLQYWIWWMSLVLGRVQQYSGAPSWEAFMEHRPLAELDGVLGLSRSAWRRYVEGEIEFYSAAGTLSETDFAAIDIPVLIGVGWWDDQETMLAWKHLQAARSAKDCRLLIGAWDHAGNTAPRSVLGGLDVSASVIDTIGHIEQFLALHLKDERSELSGKPRCRIFRTGENRWDEMDEWPHPKARFVDWFLASEGDARGLKGNGRLTCHPSWTSPGDTFVYDPDRPARDLSSLTLFAWADPPLDCRYLQRRTDVLVYTSAPLEKALFLSGRYEAILFVSSDCVDTDIHVSISDVHPDGRAIALTASNAPPTALRMRYREGCEPRPMEPGAIYEVRIEGSWLHHVFKPGHRVRFAVSCGIFPFAARNAGTGAPWFEDRILRPQTNTIHHSSKYPSRIVLPIVSEDRPT